MQRINPFDSLPNNPNGPVFTDITKLASCNEIMNVGLGDIFLNWYTHMLKNQEMQTEQFYRKTYIPKLKGLGGIFNKKRGDELFTVEEFNNRNHHDTEFMIHELLKDSVPIKDGEPNTLPYLLCYRNLCLYLNKVTRGLFNTYKPKI